MKSWFQDYPRTISSIYLEAFTPYMFKLSTFQEHAAAAQLLAVAESQSDIEVSLNTAMVIKL